MANEKSAADYEVGHSKPPKEHQFKPGQSGNPKGKPKGTVSLTKLLKKKLRSRPDLADGLVTSTITHALKGSHPHLKELWSRVDGNPRSHLTIAAESELVAKVLDAAKRVLPAEHYVALMSELAREGGVEEAE